MEILSKQGGSIVERHGNIVIKKGIRVSKHEADMMNIVKDIVPVPKILNCYTEGKDTVIEMEYVEGDVLQDVLPYFTDEQKQLLIDDLESIISCMRKLTSKTIGPIKNESLPLSGIYENELHLNQCLLNEMNK